MIWQSNKRDTSLIDWLDPVVREHPLNQSLAAWYLAVPNHTGFGTGTWRDLMRKYDGTLTSMEPATDWNTSTLRPGGFGELEFDGSNEYVDCGDVSELDGTDQFTWSGWFKRRAAGDYNVMTKGESVNDRTGMQGWIDGEVYFVVNNGSNAFANFTTNDANWHHIAFVFNGNLSGNTNRFKAYLDGQPQSLSYNLTIPATTTSNAASLLIGRNNENSTTDGFHDDIRIDTRAFSSENILDLYSESKNYYPGMIRRIDVKSFGDSVVAAAGRIMSSMTGAGGLAGAGGIAGPGGGLAG